MIADLIDYLLADSTLAALVSGRIYPETLKKGAAVPAVTLSQISGAPLYADDGETGLVNERVQIDCWAETYAAARAAANAVKGRLSAVADVTQGDTTFILVMLDNEQDRQEPGSQVAEYRHRVIQDYIIWR